MTCIELQNGEKYCDSSKKILLARQDTTASPGFFTTSNWLAHNVDDPSAKLYSRIGELDNRFKSSDGKFHFELCYPNVQSDCLIWEQVENPLEVLSGGTTVDFTINQVAVASDATHFDVRVLTPKLGIGVEFYFHFRAWGRTRERKRFWMEMWASIIGIRFASSHRIIQAWLALSIKPSPT